MNDGNYALQRTLSHVEAALVDRDREIVAVVSKLSLVSGAQLRRLLFEAEGNGRTDGQRARRALLRLTRLGVLTRLERRIGGIKSGSEGFLYRLDSNGQRLALYWAGETVDRGRRRPEPGERFVRHRLAVSELYVRLVEAARRSAADDLEILEFQAEPQSWRSFEGYGGVFRLLKPDAFARLGVGDRELWWFCELDLGTVSHKARESQAASYRSYWRSGAAGEVMPRVLWLTTNQLVAERARAAIRPSGEPHGLFVVTTIEQAAAAAGEKPGAAR